MALIASSMPAADDGGEAIDRLFDALSRGDLAAARDCLTDDARVWHCFDRIPHDRDSIAGDWASFVAGFTERSFNDVRRRATADGFVQQHLMVVRNASGRVLAWDVCVVVTMRDGRIALLEEYIDRGGYFSPAEA